MHSDVLPLTRMPVVQLNSTIGSWASWAIIIVLTLVLANSIAYCLEAARARRVRDKTAQLTRLPGKQIPVTVITGFLGAGKTALVNRLLGESVLRICVIENEKGAVSIDHALLRSQNAAGIIVLKNGCMCCSADGAGESELERVLDRLAELASGAGGDAEVAKGFASIDYIVIETSGLADPGPILQTFFRRDVQARFKLDGVVAVVDAKHISHHLMLGGFLSRSTEAGRQVGFADVVLLNKTDIATTAEIDAATAAIQAANPTARVIQCVRCIVDAASLLSRRFLDVDRVHSLLKSSSTRGEPVTSEPHIHVESVTAITIDTCGTAFALQAVQAWLQGYVGAHWKHIYRVKGLVWVYVDTEVADSPEANDLAHGSGVQNDGDDEIAEDFAIAGEALPRLFVVQGVHAEVHGTVLGETESAEVAEKGTKAAAAGEELLHGHARSAIHADVTRVAASVNCELEPLRTGVVVIGSRLDEKEVRASFAAACGPTGRPFTVLAPSSSAGRTPLAAANSQ